MQMLNSYTNVIILKIQDSQSLRHSRPKVTSIEKSFLTIVLIQSKEKCSCDESTQVPWTSEVT